MTDYLHGVEVKEVSSPPAVTSVNSSVIGLVGTLKKLQSAPAAQSEANVLDEPAKLYLIKSFQDFEKQFKDKTDDTGTLYHAVLDIFSQSAAEIVISPIENNNKKDAAIKLLLNSPSELNVTPKILIAPGLDSSLEEVKNTASALKFTAEKLKSIALVDVIKPTTATTDTDFLNQVKKTNIDNSDRLYLLYPYLVVKRNIDGKEIDMPRPASSLVAGLIVKSDTERGFWYSPSNYPLSNIAGVATQIPFFFGEKDCLANQLNAANINTIIWQGSYRLWGNKSFSTQSQYKFLSVRRTADVLNRSLMEAHAWAIDQNITKNLKDTILDSVNNYMRKLKMLGAIINGTCWIDPEKNTEESLSAGKLYFNFDFTPPYPAERITFTSILTNKYIKEVLS